MISLQKKNTSLSIFTHINSYVKMYLEVGFEPTYQTEEPSTMITWFQWHYPVSLFTFLWIECVTKCLKTD